MDGVGGSLTGGLYRILAWNPNGINTGQKGLSPPYPQGNESIDPEVSIFAGYREYLLTSGSSGLTAAAPFGAAGLRTGDRREACQSVDRPSTK